MMVLSPTCHTSQQHHCHQPTQQQQKLSPAALCHLQSPGTYPMQQKKQQQQQQRQCLAEHHNHQSLQILFFWPARSAVSHRPASSCQPLQWLSATCCHVRKPAKLWAALRWCNFSRRCPGRSRSTRHVSKLAAVCDERNQAGVWLWRAFSVVSCIAMFAALCAMA